MKKIILALFLLFLSLQTYSQGRLMYIQKEGKKHLYYKIKNRYRVKITLSNTKEIKGRINLLNDTQFYIGTDTLHIESVRKIRRIVKSRRTAADILVPVGVVGATSGYLLLNSKHSNFNGFTGIFLFFFSYGLLEAGSVAAFTGGLFFLTDISQKSIDGVFRKLIIKTIPKKSRPKRYHR